MARLCARLQGAKLFLVMDKAPPFDSPVVGRNKAVRRRRGARLMGASCGEEEQKYGTPNSNLDQPGRGPKGDTPHLVV